MSYEPPKMHFVRSPQAELRAAPAEDRQTEQSASDQPALEVGSCFARVTSALALLAVGSLFAVALSIWWLV